MKPVQFPLLSSLVAIAALLTSSLLPAEAGQVMARLIFANPPAETEPIGIATPLDGGDWKVHAEIDVRPSFVTDWIELPQGELRIVRKEQGRLNPVGSFQPAQGARRVLVVVVGKADAGGYRTQCIDPAKAGFGKGMLAVVNASEMNVTVTPGGDPKTVAPGQVTVLRPLADENDGYRLLVNQAGEDGQAAPSYDRYGPAPGDSREFVVVLPGGANGVQVVTATEFGPFK